MSTPEIVVYHTGLNISASTEAKSYEVCRRISRATGFRLEHVKNFEVGTIPIVYGLFRDTDRVMRKAYWSGEGFWYVDHGFWNRGHYDGHYRFINNGMWPNNIRSDRKIINTYGYDLIPVKFLVKPMRAFTGNGTIVICAPALEGSMFLPFIKVMPEEWIEGVKYKLEKQYPCSNVCVSTKHPGNRLTDKWLDVPDLQLIVGHDSSSVVTALENGIPALNISYDDPIIYNGELRQPTPILSNFDRKYYLCQLSGYQSKLADLRPQMFK